MYSLASLALGTAVVADQGCSISAKVHRTSWNPLQIYRRYTPQSRLQQQITNNYLSAPSCPPLFLEHVFPFLCSSSFCHISPATQSSLHVNCWSPCRMSERIAKGLMLQNNLAWLLAHLVALLLLDNYIDQYFTILNTFAAEHLNRAQKVLH